jgi:uncharacterized protein
MIRNQPMDNYEFNINPENEIIVKRHLFGKTQKDIEVENLEIPPKPIWLKVIVLSIRFYQAHISERLGNRCVFDPSCSHYSELAFRQKGLIRGVLLTIKRLNKCRPQNGGIDELK